MGKYTRGPVVKTERKTDDMAYTDGDQHAAHVPRVAHSESKTGTRIFFKAKQHYS
jgi:hypothetical protein